jgi:hypothetical protein
MLLLVVPVISLSSILSSLLIVSLSRPRCIVLAPDLLFHCSKFLVTEHIRPQSRTYPARARHIQPSKFNGLKLSEFHVWLPIHPPPPLCNFQTLWTKVRQCADIQTWGEGSSKARRHSACGWLWSLGMQVGHFGSTQSLTHKTHQN